MSRIRYKNQPDGNAISVQRFQHSTSGARYKIFLNHTEHQWFIIDDYSDLVAASGYRVHPHKMKIDARDALAALGIVMEKDSRKKRKQLTIS
jgi:hypothetical protein